MHELYFLGMDVIEETRIISKLTTTLCTDGMTEDELKAYELGIENALSALKAVLDTESNVVATHIDNFDAPTELTFNELQVCYLET